jgi:hypothetical protein
MSTPSRKSSLDLLWVVLGIALIGGSISVGLLWLAQESVRQMTNPAFSHSVGR